MRHDEDCRELELGFELRFKKLLEAPIGVDKFFQHNLGFYDTTDELEEEEFISLMEVL
jgi:hypothetical protein